MRAICWGSGCAVLAHQENSLLAGFGSANTFPTGRADLISVAAFNANDLGYHDCASDDHYADGLKPLSMEHRP